MIISKYVAQVQLQFDKKSIANVDKQLKLIETKLKNFGKNNRKFALDISTFRIDQTALNTALGSAMTRASHRVPFEISRFIVNDRALLAALLRAQRRIPPLPPGPPPRPGPNPPVPPRPGSRARVGVGLGLGSVYGPALALGLGGYGLGALNRRNQEVVSAQLQSSAVVQQAGGTAQQGAASFEYLRGEANRIGFNYLDASQDYNKLISGLTGSGVGLGESQKVFSGFAELARVNKLDKTTQNRLFRALSQVAGKGKLQSEELNIRLAV